jgi:hypothetical protein
MDRKSAWLIAGMILGGFLILSLSNVLAQRFVPQSGNRDGEVGRFVVVRSSADLIILLDTTNGDLYNAVPSDIKPYAARPHFNEALPWEKQKTQGVEKMGKGMMKMDRKMMDKEAPAFKDKGDFQGKEATKRFYEEKPK